jgi:hypothetical protein
MTTTSKIDEHIPEAVMTVVLTASPACPAPTAAHRAAWSEHGDRRRERRYPQGPC